VSSTYSASVLYWKTVRNGALQGRLASEDPLSALTSAETALTSLASAIAHATLARFFGWGPPHTFEQMGSRLKAVLPIDWHIATPEVPAYAEAAFMAVVRHLHHSGAALGTTTKTFSVWIGAAAMLSTKTGAV
jgi:hypothetical protein